MLLGCLLSRLCALANTFLWPEHKGRSLWISALTEALTWWGWSPWGAPRWSRKLSLHPRWGSMKLPSVWADGYAVGVSSPRLVGSVGNPTCSVGFWGLLVQNALLPHLNLGVQIFHHQDFLANASEFKSLSMHSWSGGNFLKQKETTQQYWQLSCLVENMGLVWPNSLVF